MRDVGGRDFGAPLIVALGGDSSCVVPQLAQAMMGEIVNAVVESQASAPSPVTMRTCPIRSPGYARFVGHSCFQLGCAEPLFEGGGTKAWIRSGSERSLNTAPK